MKNTKLTTYILTSGLFIICVLAFITYHSYSAHESRVKEKNAEVQVQKLHRAVRILVVTDQPLLHAAGISAVRCIVPTNGSPRVWIDYQNNLVIALDAGIPCQSSWSFSATGDENQALQDDSWADDPHALGKIDNTIHQAFAWAMSHKDWSLYSDGSLVEKPKCDQPGTYPDIKLVALMAPDQRQSAVSEEAYATLYKSGVWDLHAIVKTQHDKSYGVLLAKTACETAPSADQNRS